MKNKGCHSSCHGSCSSSCHGDCHGGCHGGYGCTGSCHGGYGCTGGCTGGYGCTGGGCTGGCGGFGGYAPPAMMPPAVIPEAPKEKGKTSADAAPATIVVKLPAEAKLMVDGNATVSTSARRVFVSPALDRGTEYFYTLQAEIVRDGKVETRTAKVAVRAGEESKVEINFPTPAVASK